MITTVNFLRYSKGSFYFSFLDQGGFLKNSIKDAKKKVSLRVVTLWVSAKLIMRMLWYRLSLSHGFLGTRRLCFRRTSSMFRRRVNKSIRGNIISPNSALPAV